MSPSLFQGQFSDPLADQRHSGSSAELEFALRLEYGEPGDPALLEALIDRYGGELYQFGRAILRGYTNRGPAKIETRALAGRVLLSAIRNPADFRGQSSVRGWLFGLAIELTRGRRWLRRGRLVIKRFKRLRAGGEPLMGEEQPADALLAEADQLPELARLVFILKFQGGLEVGEIAQVLDRLPEEIQACLERVRDQLSKASLDGQDELERNLRGAVRARLQAKDFRLIDAPGFKAQTQASLRPRRRLPQIDLPVAKFGGLALVLIIAGLSAWLGLQLNQQVDADLQVPSREDFPAPLEVSDPVVRGLVPGEPGTPAAMPNLFNVEPSLSADGRYLAFTSTFADLAAGEEQVNVYVYDRVQGGIELISAAGDGQSAGGDSQSPSISADGRWLVFTSTAPDLVPEGASPCGNWWNGIFGECRHVYLHDRQYGYTQLLSEGSGGIFPSISEDGRVIAYWSPAEAQTPGQAPACQQAPAPLSCANVALYDRITGMTEQIPVGRIQPPPTPLSLSADGRYTALTLFPSDGAANRLEMGGGPNAYVYDRLDRVFEPQNQASDGTPAAGMSFNPSISADGRYVAFASSSEDMAPDDSNQRIDVFLRDRRTGEVELLSLAPDGQPGNDDSGISPFGRNAWGQTIDISPDGRFVLFTSSAHNMAPDETVMCGDFFNMPPCNQIVIYDRAAGRVRPVVSANQTESIYSYPQISADGRWAAVMEQSLHCTYFEVCANIRLQNLETGDSFVLNSDPRFSGEPGFQVEFLGEAGRPRYRVNTLAFSNDGEVLAVGTSAGNVELWDFPERELLHTLVGHEKLVSSVALSPDGALVASGSHDATVLIWRAADGALLARFHGLPGLVRSVAFSPNGRYLAVGALRAIWIWENTGGQFVPVERYDYPTSYVGDLAFSPDGRYLIFSPGDKYVWVQRVSDGEVIMRLAGHAGKIRSIALSRDGSYLATSAQDFQANLWRLITGPEGGLTAEYMYTLRHNEWVSNVAFSPDGELLATAAYDHAVRLWNVEGGDLVQEYPDRRYDVLNLAFYPKGGFLVGGTNTRGVSLREIVP